MSPVYHKTVSELSSYEVKPISITEIFSGVTSISLQIPEWLGKFVSGGLLGFLVALSGLVEKRKGNSQWSSIFFGGLLFGVMFGLLGIVIPTVYSPWINYAGYPIVEVLLIFVASRLTPKK